MILPDYEPNLPERITYKSNLSAAWRKLEAAMDDVDAAVEERLDSMIPLRIVNDELKNILKSTIKNGGKMTDGQIDAVNRYFGWEKSE
jgi:hypothetical protein